SRSPGPFLINQNKVSSQRACEGDDAALANAEAGTRDSDLIVNFARNDYLTVEPVQQIKHRARASVMKGISEDNHARKRSSVSRSSSRRFDRHVAQFRGTSHG